MRADGMPLIDIKISIPELKDVGSFWIRGYPTHHTFEQLEMDCVNYPVVAPFRAPLERVRASRHFWFGEQMMLRKQAPSDLTARITGNNEVSLTLRRDYYKIGPPAYVRGGAEFLYLDAEA